MSEDATTPALLEGLRHTEYRRLVQQSQRARDAGRDPRRHLISVSQFPPGQQQDQPVTLAQAATAIRAGIDEPNVDWRHLHGLAIAAIRELASRVLSEPDGNHADAAAYARALSDLAVAISLHDETPEQTP